MTVGTKVKQTLAQLKTLEAMLSDMMHYAQKQEDYTFFKQSSSEVEKMITEVDERVKQMEREEPQYKGV